MSLFIGVWLCETLKLKRELCVCEQMSMKHKQYSLYPHNHFLASLTCRQDGGIEARCFLPNENESLGSEIQSCTKNND